MSSLLVLPEDRVAQEVRRWEEIEAGERQWRRAFRRRLFWLVVRCGVLYVAGGIIAWGSFTLTGDWAQIALWGGLLLSNLGPMSFGYAFWMRETGMWQ
jgi:hypothetical protein